MSPDPHGRSPVRRALDLAHGVRLDLTWGLANLLVNGVAAAPLTPRALRYLLYRLAGLHVRTPGISHRAIFEGPARNVTIGRDSYLNTDCFVEAAAPVTIGRECALAMQVSIITSGHDLTPDGRWTQERTARPVTIGDHVWLGARVVVLGGVTIGDHAVVAAGAVVTKDCDAWGLYAGIPARKLRDLRERHPGSIPHQGGAGDAAPARPAGTPGAEGPGTVEGP